MATQLLTERLQRDLTEAMKRRDQITTSTLRMVLSALRNAEVAGDEARSLDDDEVESILLSEAKKRAEAAEVYEQAERAEAAQAERAELAVIRSYLPEQMSADELASVVDEEIDRVVTESGEGPSPKLMGRVIASVRERVGSRVEGAAIAAQVKQRLSS